MRPWLKSRGDPEGVRSSRLKAEIRGLFSPSLFLILSLSLCLAEISPVASYAGLRGMPEGKPKVEVGSKAPLDTEDLRKAHQAGKAILLMFGNPDHCIYCEKVWGNINDLRPHYEKEVAPILKIHRASKFWGPENEAVALGERYGVIGEPWLFLIDKEGIVRHIFIGLTGRSEIEKEVKRVVEGGALQGKRQ
ncbi:MAG: thioredoxin family protein [Candidatus Tectomicrobia bacterium]|uniref:Thioredoxin family protein n=1 Tax=Tectimicrobiota bacterium TaxID=2528274 RepID=A0A932CNS2_UNCTE|nr:thioredoxin family protein [Candidatus Tectomicrobia bacterium]